ncbi:MAG: amidase [Actinomycetota bacterium]|nr:amidase [Actinomycetota bacterium]
MATSAVNCVERWDAAHARFVALDGKVKSVITWIDGSRERAVELDEIAAAGGSAGSLHGLLVGLKDNIDTAGVPTTAGAGFLADNVPIVDAACVERACDHGAVIVAKLNMAELAWGATTQNATYGACRNPWDLDRIPGGSSGGSGAALAARLCEASLGTDTGASVRVPAALNGVVGLRPTTGAISNRGVYPVAYSQDTVGPMAPLAQDVARLTEAVMGFDIDDPYSVEATHTPPTALIGQPVAGLRIGVPETFFFDDLDPAIATRLDAFIEWLRDRGAAIVPVADFGQGEAFEHWTRIVQCEGAELHRERLLERPGDFSADVLGRISVGLEVAATELARSLDWRQRYRRRLDRIFAEVDLILTPVVPIDVPAAEGYDSRAQTQLLGRITYPWALHAGPTMSLPIGFHGGSGLPVSAALSAGRWGEATLFRVATAYQCDTQWHEVLPPLLATLEENL